MRDKLFYKWEDFYSDVKLLAAKITNSTFKYIYGVPTGGVPLALSLGRELNLKQISSLKKIKREEILVCDDIVDSGKTRNEYKDYFFVSIHYRTNSPTTPNFYLHETDKWVVYPWEKVETSKNQEDTIIRMLQMIGEDPNREGLLETPTRVIKAMNELYSGYGQDPKKLIKIFDSDGCDQIVLVKNIEMFSTCEHHMLPFVGKAHIAYIPDKHVIGVSKLARLLEIYSRRLQIQERIGEQVTYDLMKYLKPKGAACVIEASHLCMKMRGINKQNSVMVTSSLKGVFMDNMSTRDELINLIKG